MNIYKIKIRKRKYNFGDNTKIVLKFIFILDIEYGKQVKKTNFCFLMIN